MNSSESIKELATALSKAQSKMKTADKASLNPHFKSKYANLEEVWEACREALTAQGLSVVQGIVSFGSSWVLQTTLMHSSGEYMTSDTPLLLPSSANMQNLGAAVTYAKRIALMAIAGISVGEPDDDAEQNRKDVEAAPREDRQAIFKELFKELIQILPEAESADELYSFIAAVCKKQNSDGIDQMKKWKEKPEMFLKNYNLYLNREKE